MKSIKHLCLIIGLITFFTSCSKDKNELLDNTWIVESIRVHADSVWQYPPTIRESSKIGKKSIALSFPYIGMYEFQKEINGCSGKVKLKSKNKINFDATTTMTTVCCDSQFADTCFNLLKNSVKCYSISENKLILSGDNGERINLIKQE